LNVDADNTIDVADDGAYNTAVRLWRCNWDVLKTGVTVMKKIELPALLAVGLAIIIIVGGCVERQLTIDTKPQGALVILNDEEIGVSPVTVSFNWYGDYNVRISKEGYETLKTHRKLKRPSHDYFPFDFFANCLSSRRIVDSYEWTFELKEKQEPERQKLIEDAEQLKQQLY
jgi:hypothetical protein